MREQTAARHFLKNRLGSFQRTQKLSGGSPERRYYRVTTSKGEFIFVSYPKDKKGFDQFLKIQRLLRKKKILSPQIFHIEPAKGWMILEDFGSMNLEKYYLENKSLHYHKKALDQLFLFQNSFQRKDFDHTFSIDQSLNEMLDAFQLLNHPFDSSENLFKEFQWIGRCLCKKNLVPSHRDFHSKNLLIHKGGVGLIDFQDAGLYPFYYDAASLIEDAYLELSPSEKAELLKYFSLKFNHKVDAELWKLAFLQRGLKAIGSFIRFKKKGQISHLQYVLPLLKRLSGALSGQDQLPYYQKYLKELINKKDLA